jgi:hypothetical protein
MGDGGIDQWVACAHCRSRFFSIAGGEGTVDPPPVRHRRASLPASFGNPRLGNVALVAAIGIPLTGDVVSTIVPESGQIVIAMSMILAVVLGLFFGILALHSGSRSARYLGTLAIGFATVELAFVLGALFSF